MEGGGVGDERSEKEDERSKRGRERERERDAAKATLEPSSLSKRRITPPV